MLKMVQYTGPKSIWPALSGRDPLYVFRVPDLFHSAGVTLHFLPIPLDREKTYVISEGLVDILLNTQSDRA